MKRTSNRSQRLTLVVAILSLGTIAGCEKPAQARNRSGQAGGEVSRNWTPPTQDVVMDVPVAAVKEAIQKRLTAPPPQPVTADQWKHTKKLYASFNQSLLWLDGKGVHQPRVTALLNAIASADSDAFDTPADCN